MHVYHKEKLHNHWQDEAPEVVSVEQFPAESSSELTNNQESNGESSSPLVEHRTHDIHVIVAPAAIAEAVRLGGINKSKEEKAATLIQSYYRGYLARCALRALRGLVKLQALVRGHNVRKQAQMTMRCMQALVRVQSKVRARRLQLVQEKLQSKLTQVKLRSNREDQHKNKRLFKKQDTEGWDNRTQSIEKILEITRRKQHAYAYKQRQKWLHSDPDDEDFFCNEHENPTRGWNWLERWMASEPKSVVPREGSYKSLSTRDDISEKTVELGSEDVNLAHHIASPYSSRQSNMDSVPSYMAPTQSAKAKVRSPGPIMPQSPPGAAQWYATANKGTARRWSYDSSARSPNPKSSAKWMATYSPEIRAPVGASACRYN